MPIKKNINPEDLPSTDETLNLLFTVTYIQADENATPRSLSLYGIMKNSAVIDNINSTYVQNTTPGIDFTKLASDTNGKGTYLKSDTSNNTNPIYYYRGAINNNNVLFGNLCWKIIRTTDTGGIKMIYNGELHQHNTDTICGNDDTVFSQSSSIIALGNYNNTQHEAKYTGYTYDNNGVETDSAIKEEIDTWYQNNLLTNYDSYLEDTVFCNDHSVHDPYTELTDEEKTAFNVGSYYIYDNFVFYGPMYRIIKKLGPSLSCPNKSDAYTKSSVLGNGKLTYPVALLTSDEIWLVGSIFNSGENGHRTYFLAGTADFYSMSPSEWGRYVEISGYDPSVLATSSYNGIASYGMMGGAGIRPVISLKPGTTATGGDGTPQNPYVVE